LGLREYIKNWKNKYAKIKESNLNELANLTKNYEEKLNNDKNNSFQKEENFRKIINDNENKIWKQKYENDIYQKQIHDLTNELKLYKNNVSDDTVKLNHLAKEINNEKEMILQEDLRQYNGIKNYVNNESYMLEIHN